VAVASVFVFAESSPLAGPMLVASLGGLYLPHVRHRQIALAISNAAGFGLSALGAAATVAAFSYRSSDDWRTTAALVLTVVCVDWVINSSIVGVASGLRGGTPVILSIRDQLRSDIDVLALAFSVGALNAANAEHTLPVAIVSIGLMLAAFETRLAGRRVFDAVSDRRVERVMYAPLVATGVLALLAHPGLGTLATGCLALFLVQAKDRLMAFPAVTATTVCGALGAVAITLGLPIVVVAALVLVTSFAVIEATAVMRCAMRAGLRLSRWTGTGLVVPSRREALSLTLIVAVIGLAALRHSEGVESSLMFGCALVVVAILSETRSQWRRFC
jgi:hypothetical protein